MMMVCKFAILLFPVQSTRSFVISLLPKVGRRALLSTTDVSDHHHDQVISKDIINFNHAGASPSPQSVVDTAIEHIKLEQVLGGYAAQTMAKERLKEAYKNVAKLINADPSEIALVESATVAWTRIFYSMVEYQDKNFPTSEEKIILLSEAEYAAQVVAACKWAKDNPGWTIRSIPSAVNPDGESTGIVDVEIFRDIFSGKVDAINPHSITLVCIAHIPTNSGIVNPAVQIGDIIDQFKRDYPSSPQLMYLLDSCQSIGQLHVDVKKVKCDGLCATGRKYLRGPRGTGFLYASSASTKVLVPCQADHDCAPIDYVPTECSSIESKVEDIVSFSYRDGAKRFEFWESNIAMKLGLGEAVRVILGKGIDSISSDIIDMANLLRIQLREINGVHLYHDSEAQCGIVTFQVDGLSPSDGRQQLWDSGFEISVVPATSTPLDSAVTKVPDLLRASISYTTTPEEISSFCQRLKHIIAAI